MQAEYASVLSDFNVKMVVVPLQGPDAPAGNRLLHLAIVKEDLGDHGMLQKQAYQFDGGVPVIHVIKARHACGLAFQLVLPHGAYIHFKAFSVADMLVVPEPFRDTDIPDAKFPIINCLPFTFDVKDQG
jgi:hypothetical protein